MIKLDVYWAHFFVHITITEEQITMTQEKKHRGLFWGIALVVLIVVLLFVWWSNQSVGKQISYSEFETMVQNNQIEYVYGVGGTFKVKEYKSGDTPSEENFWKFANSRSADYYFTVATAAEIEDVKTMISQYNNGELTINGNPVNAGGTYRIVIGTRTEPESFLSQVLPYLSLLLVVGITYFVFKAITSQNNKSLSFGKTRAKTNQISKVRFSDVAGAKEEKQELIEIVDFLKHPKKYTDLGARIPKGVLLVGQPGTGKTLLAKAVAGESNVPFFKISGSDFVEMFVGVGASRVRDLFDQAKQNAPCIVFIDEIDAVGRQRGAGLGGGNDEREQTLNQLLVEMDGFDSNEGIIVMAATNRPDVLDPALLRPGRFDRQIVVNMPDINEREEILKVHARNKKFAENVTFKNLARITSGFSGADLENLLNEAAILAARDNRPRITMEDVNEAANKVQMGPQKRSHIVSERDRKITAYHESGHAILHKLLPDTDDVHEVSIIQRGMAGGYTMSRPSTDESYVTYSKLNQMICTFMGGRVAEDLIFGDITTGASSDIEQATKLARKMVTQFGMSKKLGFINFGSTTEVFIGRDYQNQVNYSEKTAGIIDDEVAQILQENYAKAKELLTNNIDKLHAMAELLLKCETIYTDEVNAVMSGVPNDEIIKNLEKKKEDEKQELAKEKEMEQKAKQQKIDDLKSRAFEAMKQSGIVETEEKPTQDKPQDEKKDSQNETQETKNDDDPNSTSGDSQK